MAALAYQPEFRQWEYEPDTREFTLDSNTDYTAANDAFNADVVEIPYQPRALFLPFHHREQRWASLVCHRRAGKTVACVAELVHRAIYTQKKNARYAYIAPFFRQAKDVAWSYLKDMVKGFATDIRESELRVILPNGAWITLYGADNPDAMRGLYLDGAILDEFGDCRPNLWAEVILPTLMDRRGWAVFIGTPKGKNEFYKIMTRARTSKKWFDLTLKASESGILRKSDLDDMRAQMSEDQYAQEMECSFEAAVLGTYYASEINMLEQKGHVRRVPYDPNFPVSVASDIGFTDSTAMWFWQQRPDGLAIIDYEEHSGEALDFYFNLLEDKPYEYDTIWLPHDARAKTLQTGRSTIEQFLDRGFPVNITPHLKVQHGIDAARLVLPSCYFDLDGCTLGFEALRAYRRKYDKVNNCFSNTPLHDWASNGSDAFRYLALVAKEHLPHAANGNSGRSRPAPLKPVEMQLNELWKERDDRLSRRRRHGRI